MPGRCVVDFRRFSTGRFVWYVSEIGDNADAVVVFTRALYGMEERSSTRVVRAGMVRAGVVRAGVRVRQAAARAGVRAGVRVVRAQALSG